MEREKIAVRTGSSVEKFLCLSDISFFGHSERREESLTHFVQLNEKNERFVASLGMTEVWAICECVASVRKPTG